MPKVIFDLDDFQIGNALENLKKIKEHFPQFKCTAFTIPMNINLITGEITMKKYKQWIEAVKECDWIEIALHGFNHLPPPEMKEFERDGKIYKVNKKRAEEIIRAGENLLKQLELPFVKVWKSPFWETSDEAYEVLKERDYIVGVDKNQPLPKLEGLKMYQYNWSIDEEMPKGDVIKAHSHCYGTNNDLTMNLFNILKLPEDSEFLTVSEYWNQYQKDNYA